MSNFEASPSHKDEPIKTREQMLLEAFDLSKLIEAKKSDRAACRESGWQLGREIPAFESKASRARTTATTLQEVETVLQLDTEVRAMTKARDDEMDRRVKLHTQIKALEREYEAMCDQLMSAKSFSKPAITDDNETIKVEETTHSARMPTFVKQELDKKRRAGRLDEAAPKEKKVKVEVVEVKEER